MEKSNFDELLERYVSGQVSDEEKTKIEAWLEVRKSEDSVNVELSSQDEEILFNKITKNIDTADGRGEKLLKGRRRYMPSWSIGIAATSLVLLAFSALLWLNSNSQSDVGKMILNDGTLVWLKGNSKLNYYEKRETKTRYAELEGEALFEVAKDTNRPFLIKCGSMTIRVLGTSFNLKLSNDSLILEVLTGRVNLSSAKDSVGVEIVPNQKVVYSMLEEISKTQLTKEEVSKITSSTEYDMKFVNTSLTDIIPKIEKKFNVDLKIDKALFDNCKVTADFTDHSLESTLQMISEVHDFEYKLNGNSVTISGKGCN